MSEVRQKIPARLESAVKGGYVAGAKDIVDDDIGKSQSRINAEVNSALNNRYTKAETYNKGEVDALIPPGQTYVSVTATEQTEDISELLPTVGSSYTVYRVGNWDGEKYNPSRYSEYTWNGTEYILLDIKNFGFDEEPTPDSANAVRSGGIATVNGYYIENPEFKRVYLDSNGRILEAICNDGTKLLPTGYNIGGHIVKPIDNPEFIGIWIDDKEHILAGIKYNGDVVFGIGVPTQVKEYIENDVLDKVGRYEENTEYINIKLDNESKILEATRTDGTKVLPSGVEIGTNAIKSVYNPQYFQVAVDDNGNIVNAIDRELDDVIYGGVNISEIKRDADISALECGVDEYADDLYIIENLDSSISMEMDNEWNIYEVKDHSQKASLFMDEETGDVYLEQTLIEI